MDEKIILLSLFLATANTASGADAVNQQAPIQTKGTTTIISDLSCSRPAHKTHDHCYKPRKRIRHDGEVRRNGRIINEQHGIQNN